MRETQVRSLGWEDPLEKEMAIHSRAIAWKIPWTREALFTSVFFPEIFNSGAQLPQLVLVYTFILVEDLVW